MHILVTGGCGFVGFNYVQHLVRNHPSYTITVLDKVTYSANEKALSLLPNVTFVKGDLRDAATIHRIFEKGVDYVVNFASHSHVDRSFVTPHDFMDGNILGISTLLNVARQYTIKKFILFSTDEVYGTIRQGSFTEKDALTPTNPYATSKACADMVALAYHQAYSLPLVLVRCVNNIGPYQHPEKVIPKFIARALEGKKLPLHDKGQHVRNWIYVQDTCNAVDVLLEKGVPGEIYNLSAGIEKTTKELALTILKLLERGEKNLVYVRDRKNNDLRYALDNAKLCSLGWTPQYGFNESIQETISWYKTHQDWWVPLQKDIIS